MLFVSFIFIIDIFYPIERFFFVPSTEGFFFFLKYEWALNFVTFFFESIVITNYSKFSFLRWVWSVIFIYFLILRHF